MLVRAGDYIRLATGESIALELHPCDALGALVTPTAASAELDGEAIEVTITAQHDVALTVPAQELGWHELDVTIDGTVYTVSIESVGSHYFTIAELRTYGQNGQTDNFTDTTRYPAAALFWARQAAESVIERNSCVSFTRRHATATIDPRKGNFIALQPYTHSAAVTDEDGNDVPAWLVSDRQLQLGWINPFGGPLTVEYIYGIDAPAPIRRAALKLAANYLRPLNRPEQATGESSDYGYITYTLAGRDGATGIPEVDAAIKQYGTVWPVVW